MTQNEELFNIVWEIFEQIYPSFQAICQENSKGSMEEGHWGQNLHLISQEHGTISPFIHKPRNDLAMLKKCITVIYINK